MNPNSDVPVEFLFVGGDDECLASVLAASDGTHASGFRVARARTHDDAIATIASTDASPFGLVVVDVASLAHRDEARTVAETLRASNVHRACPLLFLTSDHDDAGPSFEGREQESSQVLALSRTLAPPRLRDALRMFAHRAELERSLSRSSVRASDWELERARLASRLEESLHFNDTFVAVVGHDLRNPLNAMLMAIQMLQMSSLAENERRFVETARTSGRRMAAMLDDLADLARVRLESGITIQRELSDFAVLARRAVAEFRGTHPDRTIEMESTGTGIGEWDGGRAEQLVSNLVGNALRHGEPEGKVHVWVDGTDRRAVRLRVHNRGHIPAEVLPSVFDAFQSGRRRRTRTGGLGLGLYISRYIARAHGGEITVSSSPETGTTVEVILPRTSIGDVASAGG